MRKTRIAVAVLGLVVATGLVIALVEQVTSWPDTPSADVIPARDHDHDHQVTEQVRLSPQAMTNLRITSKPLHPEIFWKTIQLPGQIVGRPGISDLGVVAPPPFGL